jgi:hypothetical protein
MSSSVVEKQSCVCDCSAGHSLVVDVEGTVPRYLVDRTRIDSPVDVCEEVEVVLFQQAI